LIVGHPIEGGAILRYGHPAKAEQISALIIGIGCRRQESEALPAISLNRKIIQLGLPDNTRHSGALWLFQIYVILLVIHDRDAGLDVRDCELYFERADAANLHGYLALNQPGKARRNHGRGVAPGRNLREDEASLPVRRRFEDKPSLLIFENNRSLCYRRLSRVNYRSADNAFNRGLSLNCRGEKHNENGREQIKLHGLSSDEHEEKDSTAQPANVHVFSSSNLFALCSARTTG
jgi:hypothetical protein